MKKAQAKLPVSLELIGNYSSHFEETLGGLARAIRLYESGAYNAALDQLPGQESGRRTAVGDYFLLYRAKAHLAANRPDQALTFFRILRKEHPSSPLLAETIPAECQALLNQKKVEAARTLLENSGLGGTAETLFLQANIEEAAGQKGKAIELYLQLYMDYVTASQSRLALDRLRILSPHSVKAPAAYEMLLRRAENLLSAGMNRTAQSMLAILAGTSAPSKSLSAKRWVLLAQAEINLGKARGVLFYLDKATDPNPALQAQILYLKAVCHRRLKQETNLLHARDRAKQLYPNSPFTEKLLYSVATYFDVDGRMAEARNACQQLLESFPKGDYVHTALWKVAFYSYLDRRYEDAATSFGRYLQAFPRPQSAVAAMYWMGRCYENLGDLPAATSIYRRAVILGPHNYYGRLASQAEQGLQGKGDGSVSAHSQTTNWPKVKEFLALIQPADSAISDPSPVALQIMERARQLHVAGLSELALEELRRAIRQFPGEKGVSYLSSRISAAKGDYDAAFRDLRRTFPDYDYRAIEDFPEEVWRLLYPFVHWKTVSEQAAANGVDPAFVMGLIRQESAFNEKAKSVANARGLMQILPSTGRMLARDAKIRYSSARLFHADTNIKLGIRHLAALMRKYEGKEELALAAYNAGDSRVVQWMSRSGNTDLAEFVEHIPFSETRNYVKQVLTNAAYYRQLQDSFAFTREVASTNPGSSMKKQP